MKIRHPTGGMQEKIPIDMTPMIDIVFQLLAFFIFTLKISGVEGDFNIKMPLDAESPGPPRETFVLPIQLRLEANPNGTLKKISAGGRVFRDFDELRSFIITQVGDAGGPGSQTEAPEVELDVDYNLKYAFTVQAITQITGYLSADGQIVKLVDKINFAPQRPPGG